MKNALVYEIRVGEQAWRLSMADLLVDDWCEVEELAGMDAAELFARFLQGGMRARKAFLYLARKQAGDSVPWDSPELNFRVGDCQLRDVTPKTRKRGQLDAEVAVEAPDPTAETSAPSPTS